MTKTMYKSKMTMFPDDEIKTVKKLNEYYFLYDISVNDVSYKICKYDIMLLSDNTYQVIKYYQTFLYNFKAGLKKRYLYYNYHNHIIYDNEEEKNNFNTLEQAQQFILQSQQVKTLSEYEDLNVLFNDRLHFANLLYKVIQEINKNSFINFYSLQCEYERNLKNELLHYLKMKFTNKNIYIKENFLYYEERN